MAGRAKKMRALVVDDNQITRLVQRRKLENAGLATLTVENGQEAVDLFVAGNFFDLILMDLEMPVMNGPKATRILRGMGVRCMIVGLTACGNEAWKKDFVDAGLTFCLDKPLDNEDVTAIMKELKKKCSSSSLDTPVLIDF